MTTTTFTGNRGRRFAAPAPRNILVPTLLQALLAVGVTAIVYYVLIERARAGVAAAGLLMSDMHMEDVDRFWAYPLSQAFGFAALAFAWVAILLGLTVATKQPPWLPFSRKAIERTHQEFTWSVIALACAHGLFLTWDRMGDTLAGSFIPWMLPYAPGRFPVLLGIVSFWLALALGPTYYLRRRLGPQRWRIAHRFTLLVYVLAVWHTFLYGSDVHFHGPLRTLLWASQLPIGLAVVWRFLNPIRPSERLQRDGTNVADRFTPDYALQVCVLLIAAASVAAVLGILATGATGGQMLPSAHASASKPTAAGRTDGIYALPTGPARASALVVARGPTRIAVGSLGLATSASTRSSERCGVAPGGNGNR